MARAAAKPAGDVVDESTPAESTPAPEPATPAPAPAPEAEPAPEPTTPAEPAPEPATPAEPAPEPTTADVVMLVSISGLRDGEPWPAAGEGITLPVAEAEAYIANGYAKPAK